MPSSRIMIVRWYDAKVCCSRRIQKFRRVPVLLLLAFVGAIHGNAVSGPDRQHLFVGVRKTDQEHAAYSITAEVSTHSGYLWLEAFIGFVRFDGAMFGFETSGARQANLGPLVDLHGKSRFYQNHWFYGMCLVALALAGVSAQYLYIRRTRARESQLKRLINQKIQELEDEVERRKRAEAALVRALDELERRTWERSAAAEADAARRKQVEAELKLSEEQFAKAFRAGPAAMNISALDTGCIIDLNEGFIKLFGFEREEVIGKTGAELGIWADPEDRRKFFAALHESGSVRNQQSRFLTKAGKAFDSLISAEAINFGGKECLLSVTLDVSEQMRLEEQLRRAQKMEAIGTLSGGIAHDFNNALTVIRGYSQILLDALKCNPALRVSVERIDEASGKAASLVRQLLAFSRQQVLQPKVFSLNTALVNLEDMLRRLIREDIELRIVRAPDLGLVKADQNQIEHAVMNLAVNARDAMPEGGKLTIETANAVLDEDYAREHVWVRPGPHVVLSVTDTGMGMQAETLSHIFEPFFTTKGVGKGTGLGLSMVYGIVKQSGGSIWVYSEAGKGTTFKIYLPREAATLPEATFEPPPPADVHGNETILLVEDDLGVRQLAKTVLTSAGYTVLLAENAAHASSLCEAYSGAVQLLLTDVVMPGIGGRELAREVTARKPEAKVLYMSGYAVNAIVHHGVLDANTFFLAKPFTPASLLSRVREMLDKRR